MEGLKYFQWIEEFMRPRKSKTNLVVKENEHGKGESSEEEEVVGKESDILSEGERRRIHFIFALCYHFIRDRAYKTRQATNKT